MNREYNEYLMGHDIGDWLDNLRANALSRTGLGGPEMERWLPCPEYEGLYEVSDLGRVRSIAGHIMHGTSDKDGYRVVHLSRSGCATVVRVHRLIAKAFHRDGENVLHCQVAHMDGTRSNNRADNLKWVSHAENLSHKKAHGTHHYGERNPRAKLTAIQAANVRDRTQSGESPTAIAREFGLDPKTVRDIRDEKRWVSALRAPSLSQGEKK